MTQQITLEDIRQAAERIHRVVRRTPLEKSRWLSRDGKREVFFKLECFQLTGSFKLRGAMSKLSLISEEAKSRGVLTISAGNHGLAVAHCAEALGLDARIVVPRSASRAKVEAIRRYPVELMECGKDYDEAEALAREMEIDTGRVFVSPYNDREVIAGQGTIALEVLADAPDLDAIVVPVGGGGLIAGVALAAKAINPGIKIFGVEPEASPTMCRALEAGRLVQIEEEETIADGLSGNIENESITFPLAQQFVDEVILVREDAIKRSIARVAREDHLMIEGSAAVSVAALEDERIEGSRIAALITGRNITLDLFLNTCQ
jgi:threonine dehydratase